MSIPSEVHIKRKTPLFDFVIKQRPDHTEIIIQFFTTAYTTKSFPQTIALLETVLPRIFKHKCFNNNRNTFRKEAADTELGHLFEHVLLEFLCMYKSKEGQVQFNLKGLTEWNWIHDPRGIFYISLNTKKEDWLLLQQSIIQTQKLMETILLANTNKQFPKQLHKS